MALMVFLIGCTSSRYRYREFYFIDDEPVLAKDISWDYHNANLKLIDENFKVELPEGAKLEIGKRVQIPDPNSAKAIGEAIGVGAGGFIIP